MKVLIYICALFFSLNSIAQTKPISSIKYKPWAKSLFWKITPPNSKKSSFIYGTMHVSNKVAFKLPDTFYNAIESVDYVALESNPAEWAQAFDAVNDANKILNLSKGNLEENIARISSKNYYESIFQIKPYSLEDYQTQLKSNSEAINSLLFRNHGGSNSLEEDTYLDLYIYKTGCRYKKQILSLEDITWSTDQVLLAEYNHLQEAKTSSYDGQNMIGLSTDLMQSYRDKDIEKLDTVMQKLYNGGSYIKHMLYIRNDTMVQRFCETLSKGKSIFAAVGTAHLPGENGILFQLVKRGYKVEPVVYDASFNPSKNIASKDSIIIPVRFSTYTSKDSTLQFQTPAYPISNHNGNKTDYYSVDMPNGIYYYLSRTKHLYELSTNKMDELLRQIDSMVFENTQGTIINKGVKNYAGYKAFEIESKTQNQKYIKQRFVITPLEIIYQKSSCKNTYLNQHSVDTFFNTLNIQYPTAIKQLSSINTNNDVDANMPIGIWESDFFDEPFSGTYKIYEGLDANQNYYLYSKNLIEQYKGIEQDTFHLNMIAEHIAKPLDITFKKSTQGFIDGVKCIKAEYINKNKENIHLCALQKGLAIHYFLIKSKDTNAINKFFNSIHLTNKDVAPIKHHDSIHNYSIVTSGKVFGGKFNKYFNELNTNVFGAGGQDKLLSKKLHHSTYYNKPYGYQITISVSDLSKFVVMPSIDSFWKHYQIHEPNDEDGYNANSPRINDNYTFCNNDSSRFTIVQYDSASSQQNRILFVLNKNKILKASVYCDTLDPNINQILSSLASIQFDDTIGKFNYVLKSKIDTYYKYVTAKDSIKKSYVKNFTNIVYSVKEDFDKLYSTLDTSTFIKNEAAVFQQYLDEIRRYPNEKLYKLFEKLYYENKNDATNQINILEALANIKNKQATELFARLVAEYPPIEDEYNEENYINDIRNIFPTSKEADSTGMAKFLFPEILSLLDYDEYKSSIIDYLGEAVKDSLIESNVYADRVNMLVIKAKQVIRKTNSAKSELEIESEKTNEGDEANVEAAAAATAAAASSYNNLAYSDPKFNSAAYINSELDMYKTLLLPFKVKRNVADVLADMDTMDNLQYLFGKNYKLLADKKPYNKAILRLYYDSLIDYKYQLPILASRAPNFNAADWGIQTQQDVMINRLIESKVVKNKKDLKFVTKKFCVNKNGQGYVYVYKFKKEKDEFEHYVAFGLFDKNDKKLEPQFAYIAEKIKSEGLSEMSILENIYQEVRIEDRVFIEKEDLKPSEGNAYLNMLRQLGR
jgi:uncharacterized protein YbaP (TraB family)